jgi:hypothetical protein
MNPALKAEEGLESDSESVLAADEAATKSADAFRTIGEAAAELGLKTHVLRFWETKFENLRPMKRPDGRPTTVPTIWRCCASFRISCTCRA